VSLKAFYCAYALLLLQDTPEDILMAVSQGVDLLDCSYPLQATANGYALSFPLTHGSAQQQQAAAAAAPPPPPSAAAAAVSASNPFGTAQDAGAVDADAGADDTKVNLWAVRHRLDGGPLVHGCSCFTCQNHSRAYVHHLLHTHEMLASVLLEMHNTHWWLGFFAAMREAIQQGRLQQYVEWFNARRQQQQQPEQPEQHAHKPAWHPHEQSA
jgi:queuine tRNA-ribosyltransferase subunit QTRTD1